MKEIVLNAFASFEALFLEFNLRRLLQWVFLAVIIVSATVFGERITGYFFFRSMEKKVALLKELHSLDQSGVKQNEELGVIYQQTVDELSGHKVEPASLPNLPTSERLWRFIGGAWFFLLLSVIFFFSKQKSHYIYIPVLLGCFFGIIGALLPIVITPWINFIGFPIVQVLLISAMGLAARRKKATQD